MSFQIGCVLATNERSACFTLCFVLFVVKREVSCGHFVALLDSRDFKQQLRMERLQRPEVCRHTAVAKNVKVTKQR